MIDFTELKICFIAGTLGQGGAERQLYEILRILRVMDVKVNLLCLTQGEYWEIPIKNLGIEVTWVGKSGSRALRLESIIRYLRNDPPHIIQSQHFYTNLYSTFAARFLGCKEIGAIRNDGIQEIRENGLLNGFGSAFFPRILAANSKKAITNLIKIGIPNKKLFYLPNTVDTNLFFPRDDKEIDITFNILAVGRLVKQKRYDRLLDIVSHISNMNISIKVRIVGEGPEKNNLVNQAKLLGISNIIEFSGLQKVILPFYQKSDILLVTSDWEGTPNVILEAMASEIPVIATNVGGIPEIIIDGENGFVIEPNNISKFSDVLVRLILDPTKRIKIGKNARNYVQKYYSEAQLSHRLNELYERTLD